MARRAQDPAEALSEALPEAYELEDHEDHAVVLRDDEEVAQVVYDPLAVEVDLCVDIPTDDTGAPREDLEPAAHAALHGALGAPWREAGFELSDLGFIAQARRRSDPAATFFLYVLPASRPLRSFAEAGPVVEWLDGRPTRFTLDEG